jgi:hypothetical protein
MSTPPPFVRLAIRTEGDRIVAYFAKPSTMEGAHFLASIHRGVVQRQPGLFDEWKELLKKITETAVKDILNVEIDHFDEQPAPEHERSGSA